ncbi:hypothetical protein OPQ81_005308 [Rhizoctonia solani]|nr:hypothetical protein OPQ81_005308 [Rhizoctonia solani]
MSATFSVSDDTSYMPSVFPPHVTVQLKPVDGAHPKGRLLRSGMPSGCTTSSQYLIFLSIWSCHNNCSVYERARQILILSPIPEGHNTTTLRSPGIAATERTSDKSIQPISAADIR